MYAFGQEAEWQHKRPGATRLAAPTNDTEVMFGSALAWEGEGQTCHRKLPAAGMGWADTRTEHLSRHYGPL